MQCNAMCCVCDLGHDVHMPAYCEVRELVSTPIIAICGEVRGALIESSG